MRSIIAANIVSEAAEGLVGTKDERNYKDTGLKPQILLRSIEKWPTREVK